MIVPSKLRHCRLYCCADGRHYHIVVGGRYVSAPIWSFPKLHEMIGWARAWAMVSVPPRQVGIAFQELVFIHEGGRQLARTPLEPGSTYLRLGGSQFRHEPIDPNGQVSIEEWAEFCRSGPMPMSYFGYVGGTFLQIPLLCDFVGRTESIRIPADPSRYVSCIDVERIAKLPARFIGPAELGLAA